MYGLYRRRRGDLRRFFGMYPVESMLKQTQLWYLEAPKRPQVAKCLAKCQPAFIRFDPAAQPHARMHALRLIAVSRRSYVFTGHVADRIVPALCTVTSTKMVFCIRSI
jgi:hypothetical protein